MTGDNGDKEPLPAITIEWDAAAQNVNVKFNTEEFKTWDFILAALGMATEFAKFQLNMARMAGVQQQQMAMMQNELVRRQLHKGPIH